MVRPRLGCWILVALLAAGCARPDPARPPVNDQTDVWFMQHMVPHLRQTTAIVYLTRDRITDPELVRLAARIHRTSQAHAAALQARLAERGLAPHGHSHQRADQLRRTDLERLSRLDGAHLDRAFVRVMTGRHRTAARLATTEIRSGGVPEVRDLARRLLASQQAQLAGLNGALTTATAAPSWGWRSRPSQGRPLPHLSHGRRPG